MWPDNEDLQIRVEAAFGADLTAHPATWTWTDLSARLTAEPIHLRAGKSAGAEHVSPGSCSITLLNDDAALTPQHPMSPYWPHVDLNLPVRVSVWWDGVWHERFAGHADQWEPTYLPLPDGGFVAVMRVTASGILRRLQQGSEIEATPMRRTYAASAPVAYWPLEDGTAADVAASALPGDQPLAITGPVLFTDIDDVILSDRAARYGTAKLVDLANGGRLAASVSPAATAATAAGWTVGILSGKDVVSATADIVLLEMDTPGGTYERWRLTYVKATTRTQVIAYDAAGAATTVIDLAGASTNLAVTTLSVWQDGGTIRVGLDWFHYVQGQPDGMWTATGSRTGTLRGVTRIAVNATGTAQLVPFQAGHLALWAGHPTPIVVSAPDIYGVTQLGALWSWRGEVATERLYRLATEDDIAIDVPVVDAGSVVRMGWQESAGALDLYRECEAADGGVLYESGVGLAYLPREERYNPPVALTIDLATYATTGGDVLAPTYDDMGVRNFWTVERRHGSSAVAVHPSSRRRGTYTDRIELNLADDSALAHQAQWRAHIGSVIEFRDPTVPIDLAENPDLVSDWLSCRVGSRLVRVNGPSQHAPGAMDRLIDGWSEVIGPRSWRVACYVSPAEPWLVGVAGVERADTNGSSLAGAVSATSTTMQLASTGPVWTTNPAHFPLDLLVGGELVRVTAITGASSPQTATVIRSRNGVVKAHPAGAPVNVYRPLRYAL